MNIFTYIPELAPGLKYALEIAFGAFFIGAVVAVPLVGARRSRFLLPRLIGGLYVEVIRAVPPLPWLFLVFFALPTYGLVLEPLEAGILVYGLISAAYLTEIYRAGFRAVPRGQSEAAAALGLPAGKVYTKILIPQAVRTILPLALAYLIGALKDSAIVSIIGVHDVASRAIALNSHEPAGLAIFLAAAALYLAVSVPVAFFGRWLSHRMAPLSTTGKA